MNLPSIVLMALYIVNHYIVVTGGSQPWILPSFVYSMASWLICSLEGGFKLRLCGTGDIVVMSWCFEGANV